MNINGVNGMNGVSGINQTSAVNRNHGTESAAKQVQADQSNISAARGAETVNSMNPNEIRIELVNNVRAQIAAGTYYSDAKLEAALLRMFDRDL